MGGKSSKDFENHPNRQEILAKLLKNKKFGDGEGGGDLFTNADTSGDYQQQRKQRVKQSMYGGANNVRPHHDENSNMHYVKTPSSRLQIDVNDPLLIATLPAPLTSVITENQQQQQQQDIPMFKTPLRAQPHYQSSAAAPPVPPPPFLNMRNHNTFNVARMQHHHHEFDRNYTDPWRNAAHRMTAANSQAAAAAGVYKQHQQSSSSNRPTKSLLLQELLECPICMNRYDNPHVLPCQHTFCKSCIVSLKSNSRMDDNKICCPICRECHQLQLENLPANYTMKRLIELEAMAAEKKEKEAAELLLLANRNATSTTNNNNNSSKMKRKPTNFKKLIQRSDSSFSSGGQQQQQHYNSRYQKHHYEQHNESDQQRKVYLKLILLCHSSAVEIRNSSSGGSEAEQHNYAHIDNMSNSSDDRLYSKRPLSSSRKQKNNTTTAVVYEDEYGQCKTFSKIGVHCDDPIEKIKSIVEQKFEIPYEEQLLVYKDKLLKHDHRSLRSYHIRNYSRLHVFDKRDVKENLDEIDPYAIDQDFVKELASSCLSSSHDAEDSLIRGERTNSIRRSARSRSRSRREEQHCYDDDDNNVYQTGRSQSQYVFHHKESPILNNFKKHSTSYRRVRKLDELLDGNNDSSRLMYAK